MKNKIMSYWSKQWCAPRAASVLFPALLLPGVFSSAPVQNAPVPVAAPSAPPKVTINGGAGVVPAPAVLPPPDPAAPGPNAVPSPVPALPTERPTVRPQPPVAGPVTPQSDLFDLPKTVAGSLRASADLAIAARNVQIDRTRADEAAGAGRPNLSTTAQATRNDQDTRIAIGNGPPVVVQKKHSELLQINLSERFDITGQIRAARSQAQLQSLADQFVFTQIRNARVLRAQTVYFNLLRAEHQVQVAQSALDTANRQLTDAQNLNAAGVGQKIDVFRAATRVAQAQQQLTGAVNQVSIARDSFNDMVGRPLSAPSQAVDVPGVTLGETPDLSGVGANGGPAFQPFTASGDVDRVDIDRALNLALASRPEIGANQVNVRVAETGITLARAGLLPGLTIGAAGNYFPTTSFQYPRQRTAAVTATLTLPLYDGGVTRDRITEARLRRANAQTTVDSTRSDVRLDVRNTYLNLSTYAHQIDSANTALAQAVAARQLAEVRYRGQVGTYLEVTDAQSALVQAQNGQIDAVYNYLVARAQFASALGQPDIAFASLERK